jgi:hypothetical protein
MAAKRRKDLADLRGCEFFRLRVVVLLPRTIDLLNARDTSWLCRCSCGNLTIARASRLLNGMKKSCGCYRRETSSVKARTLLAAHVNRLGAARELPAMTRSESLFYRKLRWRIGYSRGEALDAIGKGV